MAHSKCKVGVSRAERIWYDYSNGTRKLYKKGLKKARRAALKKTED